MPKNNFIKNKEIYQIFSIIIIINLQIHIIIINNKYNRLILHQRFCQIWVQKICKEVRLRFLIVIGDKLNWRTHTKLAHNLRFPMITQTILTVEIIKVSLENKISQLHQTTVPTSLHKVIKQTYKSSLIQIETNKVLIKECFRTKSLVKRIHDLWFHTILIKRLKQKMNVKSTLCSK